MTPSQDQPSTETLYNQHAQSWVRTEPTILSDYTARPRVLERAGSVHGKTVLDLGCGEGYVSRLLAQRGTASIVGVDQSEEMILGARARNAIDDFVIDYIHASATSWVPPRNSFDLALAIFLLNYLTVDESVASLKRAHSSLKLGGKLIMTLPHPSLPWLRPEEPPFFFRRPAKGYQESRDEELEGSIWSRHGHAVPVRCRHKTLTDIFDIIRRSGFEGPIHLEELCVTDAHLALDHGFFGPLRGSPLHLLVEVTR